MTGATGDLTPDEMQRDLVPGERREVSGPERRADVTQAQAARAPTQPGELGDPGGDLVEGEPTNMATRESGDGSEHGLSPEPRDPVAGGDEVSDHEEHF